MILYAQLFFRGLLEVSQVDVLCEERAKYFPRLLLVLAGMSLRNPMHA